jgi:hypothetical protein
MRASVTGCPFGAVAPASSGGGAGSTEQSGQGARHITNRYRESIDVAGRPQSSAGRQFYLSADTKLAEPFLGVGPTIDAFFGHCLIFLV